MCLLWTNLIAGLGTATALSTARPRRAMYRATWLATRTSTRTGPGASTRLTVTSGSRIVWLLTGRRTATVIGPGSTPGVGPGSTTRPGASPCPITAAGRTSATGGDGYR